MGMIVKSQLIVRGSFKAGSFEISLEAIHTFLQALQTLKGLFTLENMGHFVNILFLRLLISSENVSLAAVMRWLRKRNIVRVEDKDNYTK